MRILLVEDEVSIAKVIKRGMEQSQYTVDVALDGVTGLDMAHSHSYSVIILDLMLPGMGGLQICSQLRAERNRTPILMLTARGSVPDRVAGLETGADDYLIKPFDFTELLARVNALNRRDKIHKTRLIRIADLLIDTSLRRVTRANKEIPLSHREYTLLEALAAREGQTLTRELIQDQIWMDEESYSNTVDVYIGMLRKKVDAEHEVKLIHTIRGLGYVLRRPDREDKV